MELFQIEFLVCYRFFFEIFAPRSLFIPSYPLKKTNIANSESHQEIKTIKTIKTARLFSGYFNDIFVFFILIRAKFWSLKIHFGFSVSAGVINRNRIMNNQ